MIARGGRDRSAGFCVVSTVPLAVFPLSQVSVKRFEVTDVKVGSASTVGLCLLPTRIAMPSLSAGGPLPLPHPFSR